MIRGTTPTLYFDLPFSTSMLKSAEITIEYSDQNTDISIYKTLADCETDGNCIFVTLTQEETLQFPAPVSISVQLRVLTTENVALATDPYTVPVGKLLADGVIE